MAERSNKPIIHAEGGFSGALGEPLYDSGNRDWKASLRELGRILRRRKWTILLVTIVVTSLVGGYVALSEADYEAYTILLVEDPSQESGEENPLRSGRIGALDRDQRNMTDQTLLLQQSLPIAKRTVRRVQQSGSEIDGPVTLLDTGTDNDTSLTQTAERLLEGYVSVRREDNQKGNALRVTVTSTNPHEAAFIANAYTRAYLDLAEERSRRRIKAAQSFLKKQVSRQRQKLQKLEQELSNYKSRTRTAGLEEETRQTVQQMGELEASLDEARVEKSRAEAALQSVQSKLEDIRPKLAARVSSEVDKEIDDAQSRIADLESRLEQIYIKNPELRDNPSQSENVVELKDEIAGLRQRVKRLTKQYISEMMAVGGTDPFRAEGGTSETYIAQLKRKAAQERVAISGAEARITALRQRLEQYRQRMEEIPESSTQIARLQRERTAAEEAYNALEQKLQDVRLANEATISMAEVVRPALVPEESVMPRVLIILAGLLFGLMLGGVIAVARHKIDTRIYTPEDLEARNYRAIGVVPDLHLAKDSQRRLQSSGLGEEDTDGSGIAHGSVQDEKTRPTTTLQNPTSTNEAYRRLHLSLQLSREGDTVRTVLVTSPEPGVGKSTTALNLAATAARAGQRALIVDADFRQPQIQEWMGSSEGPSLADLLENPDAELNYLELATDVPNLYAIAQREALSDAGVVLSSPEMERLFGRLRGAFDFVVFDTPPVLAVADATFLATRCDATLIVVQAGKTEAEELELTSDELRDARADVVGTVLNRFNPSEPSSYTSRYQYQDYADDAEGG